MDPEKTSPYEFYQYWRKIADADVEKCLALLTFLPMEEVHHLGIMEGSKINQAKEVLAFYVTKLIHGETAAIESQTAARKLFSGDQGDADIPSVDSFLVN